MVKLQVLPNSGQIYKVAVSFGYVEFLHSLSSLEVDQYLQAEFSPFLALNMTFPELFYSYASIYVDSRKVCVGINTYPTYKNFGDRLSLVCELNYIRHPSFRNRLADKMMTQAGIRFKTSERIRTSFTYQNHETLNFSVDCQF